MRQGLNLVQAVSSRLRTAHQYLPVSNPAFSQPSSFAETTRASLSPVVKRWRHILVALGCASLVVLLGLARHGLIPNGPEILRSRPTSWGLSEPEGWLEGEDLADLGDEGEEVYRIGFEAGLEGTEHYFDQLHQFSKTLPSALQHLILSSLAAHLPPSHARLLSSSTQYFSQALIDHKTIYQTDKTLSESTEESVARWSEYNGADGWEVEFFDDQQADTWVRRTFGDDSEVVWAWDYMNRGVLRADFFRYLIPLVSGGVYADVDVEPYKAIEDWGTRDVECLSLASTDGPHWRDALALYPTVVVGIDVDVHRHPTWTVGWPRPLGICQWTLGSAPSHPIFLDTVRRVVNSTKVVRDWEAWRVTEIENLRKVGKEAAASEVEGLSRGDVMSVLDWTGPGAFTDAVLAFLLARYNVTWHRLRGLDHPLRIGDVLVLPITAFSPGGEADFHSGHHWDPQGAVVHNFRGSWKGDGS